ncbi:MAG: cysteine hydrolase [Chloroflexi bacterium]|nr:cysteine hydrolase [Chloroflexota bacterium]
MATPNIDPKRTALILCDFQNGLVMSQRPIEPWGAKTLIANAKKVLDHARKVGMAIIYVRVGYRQDLKDLAPKAFTPGENWGSPSLAVGNVEQQIVEELTPEPGDFIVTKHTISPFNNTDIEVYLRRAGAENIILMGYSTTAVIMGSFRDAVDKDYNVAVVSDACAAGTKEEHEVSMNLIFPRNGWVGTSDEVIAAIGS